MGILVNVAKWECPICHKKGRQWQKVWKARKYGRQHLRNYHKEYIEEPILKVMREEDVWDGR
jgi:hypothetical protein